MDDNQRDIGYIEALRAIAPTDWWEVHPHGYVDKDTINSELLDLIEELAPSAKFVERDGKWIMPASDWIVVHRITTQKLFARMRHKSLELARVPPSDAELAQAPSLNHWVAIRDRHPSNAVLIGLVTGHPVLKDQWIRTSRLCGIDRDGHWARTVSRWYQLEEQATPEIISREFGRRASTVWSAAISLDEVTKTFDDRWTD